MEIEIDFEVFKALTTRRRSESMTYNDVIRELLGLEKAQPGNGKELPRQGWRPKGVEFPHGTRFRTNYKGREYEGVVQNGALVLNGRRFQTPSGAGRSITGYSVNGWIWWKCKLPDADVWTTPDVVRRRRQR